MISIYHPPDTSHWFFRYARNHFGALLIAALLIIFYFFPRCGCR